MDSLNPYFSLKSRNSKQPYTQEQLNDIKQLLDRGWSPSRIHKEYPNVSTDSINNRIRQNNWIAKKKQRASQLSQKELDEIKNLLTQQVSLEEIGKKYDISVATILKRQVNGNWAVRKKRNKYSFNEHYFDEIDNEHKAYWLGFLMADGYVLSARHRTPNESQSFGFAINVRDIELFRYFKQDLCAENPVNIYQDTNSSFKSGNLYGRILLTSQHMVERLKTYGVVENKTLKARMPALPTNLIRHFIRGYSDGDGSIVIDKNHRVSWGFCGTKEMLMSIQNFFHSHYKLSQRFPERQVNNWDLKITGWQNVPNYLHKVYENATIYLQRKYLKYIEIWGSDV